MRASPARRGSQGWAAPAARDCAGAAYNYCAQQDVPHVDYSGSAPALSLAHGALGALGAVRAWSVHGQGMDELTTTGETEVAEWREGVGLRRFTITPEAVGLPRSSLADLTGGDPAFNAAALRRMVEGEAGAYRDIVLLNAAAAFLVGDAVETLREGVELAGAVVDDGRALKALDQLISITNAA
jgi:anthranilate phosphoribosyltransferase